MKSFSLVALGRVFSHSKRMENSDIDFIWKQGFSGVIRMDSHKHPVRWLSLKRWGI